jgi:hypothetical protein
VLVIALTLALAAGPLVALPNTHGSPTGDSRSSAPDAFLQYDLSLHAPDIAIYTHPVYGFSFPYPKGYVLSIVARDDGETIRAVSPRFVADIEVTHLGPVVASNADEETLPLIIRRAHPTLGHVSDAWFTDGEDAYHVRLYAPHEECVDATIRHLIYNEMTFKNGETGNRGRENW